MARKLANGLTDQQKAFCDAYRADPEKNASRAYKSAYPGCKSDAAARAEASKLLTNPNVSSYLDAKEQKATQKADITEERILGELAKIAFFDPRKLYDEAGNLLPIKDWPDEVAGAVASVEFQVERHESGDEVVTGTKKVRMWDKKGALELLGKSRAIKMFVERLEHTGKDGGPIETSNKIDLSDLTKDERAALAGIISRRAGKS